MLDCSGILQELWALAQLGDWPQGERMGAHSFRKRAVRAILEPGCSFSQLLRPGQWNSSAYQLYLDLGREGTGP